MSNFLFLLLAIILGIIRIFLNRKSSLVAVDQWYWLKYREAVRMQKKCPPNLPEYILDLKQWYPPVFGYFLSVLPDGIFRYKNFIAQFLSFFRLFVVVLLTSAAGELSITSLLVVILIYLSAPILISYDLQINARVLGALILDILMFLFFEFFEFNISIFLFPLIALTILLLFTHKMTHQLYIFLLVSLSIFYKSFVPLLIYLSALFISLYFLGYRKYLKAHLDIVSFWHRNRYKLGAHQFYESPVYGKPGFVYKNRIHGYGLKSILKKLSLLIGMFPSMFFLVFILKINFWGVIIAATLSFSFLTTFVPLFYCLGAGFLYTYNLVSFGSFYILTTNFEFSRYIWFLLFTVFLLTSFAIWRFYLGLMIKEKLKKEDLFHEVIRFLRDSKIDRIMVIPFQLPDEVAYKAKKKVFFGAHGYGFKWIEPYFPVFKVKVEEALYDWNLGGIFLKKDYWPEFFLEVDQSIFEKLFENKEYILFKIKNWSDGEKIPRWAQRLYR